MNNGTLTLFGIGFHLFSPHSMDNVYTGPISRSLTTTNEISVDVFSSSYLDVSVGWVSLNQWSFLQGNPWVSAS